MATQGEELRSPTSLMEVLDTYRPFNVLDDLFDEAIGLCKLSDARFACTERFARFGVLTLPQQEVLLELGRPGIKALLAQNDALDPCLQVPLLEWEEARSADHLEGASVGDQIAARRDLLPETIELLREGSVATKGVLARNPTISEDLQWMFLREGSAHVMGSLARNSSLSQNLQQAIYDDFPEGRYFLAQNPSLLPELAGLLSNEIAYWDALTKNQCLVLSEELNVQFLDTCFEGSVWRWVVSVDPETVRALRPSWKGSVRSLVEACQLLAR